MTNQILCELAAVDAAEAAAIAAAHRHGFASNAELLLMRECKTRRATLVALLKDLSPAPKAPTEPARRLIVDIGRLVVSLDGNTYDVKSVQALRWLAVLAETPGLWLSSRDLEDRDPELFGARTHLLKKSLPKPVRDLIDSKTGRGSRLKLA